MKKVLVVVDMQKDFIDGALGTKEAEAIVPAVVDKIHSYPQEDVYATRDTHGENYMDTQEGKYLPVPHCIRDTEGWQLQPEIGEMILPEHIFDKPTFGSVDLVERIKEIAGSGEIGGTVHRYLCGLQRAASEGLSSGDEDLGGSRLLRGRHAGKTRGGPGDDEVLPDCGGGVMSGENNNL